MPDSRVLQVLAVLFVAVIFGGGGSGAGVANLAVQLVALFVLACNRKAFVEFFRRAPRLAACLVAMSLLLPILQSVPLPPSLWRVLPGRDLVEEALGLVGPRDVWMPLSLNVRRTLVAFLSLIPLLTVLVLSWDLSEPQKRQVLAGLVVAGGLFVLLGAQQLAFGNRSFIMYSETFGSRNLQGTFANRNSGALFIDIVLCALVGLFPWGKVRSAKGVALVAVAILLVLGVLLTRSRGGMVLLTVPAILWAMQLWTEQGLRHASRGKLFAGGLVVLLVLGFGAAFLSGNQRIQQSLSRFDDLGDARPSIWQDAVVSVRHFWPLGSGIGTFDEVFQLDESLENISPGRAARAHNDYLEAALESGVAGIALVLAWLGLLVASCVKAFRKGGVALVSVGAALLVVLQSILDYPLRNQTLLCVAGLMLAFLIGVRPSSVSRVE